MPVPALLFRCARYGAIGLVLGAVALDANAQAYPARTITAFYPYPAGSTSDLHQVQLKQSKPNAAFVARCPCGRACRLRTGGYPERPPPGAFPSPELGTRRFAIGEEPCHGPAVGFGQRRGNNAERPLLEGERHTALSALLTPNAIGAIQ